MQESTERTFKILFQVFFWLAVFTFNDYIVDKYDFHKFQMLIYSFIMFVICISLYGIYYFKEGKHPDWI